LARNAYPHAPRPSRLLPPPATHAQLTIARYNNRTDSAEERFFTKLEEEVGWWCTWMEGRQGRCPHRSRLVQGMPAAAVLCCPPLREKARLLR